MNCVERLWSGVHVSIESDPIYLYVFISKDKKKVKILHWEEDGYWLHQKRLGVGTFQIRLEDSGMDVITGIDLEKLLSGISFAKIKLSKNIKNNLAKSPLI